MNETKSETLNYNEEAKKLMEWCEDARAPKADVRR